MGDEPGRQEERNRKLGTSFRQARREMVVILAAWGVFLVWTGLACGLGSRLEPGEPVATLFGMPRWAFLGVILPWLAASSFAIWFAMRFMQDTDLDPDRGEAGEGK